MLRALSTRSRHRYERLGDESEAGLLERTLRRTTSVPVKLFSPSKRLGGRVSATQLVALQENPYPPKQAKKPSATSKFSHPIFTFLEARRRKKKTTAKPEFARYLEYLKEGGVWDVSSTMPTIHYK